MYESVFDSMFLKEVKDLISLDFRSEECLYALDLYMEEGIIEPVNYAICSDIWNKCLI